MEAKEIERLIKNGRDFCRMPKEDQDYKSDQELKKPQPPLFKAKMRNDYLKLPRDFSDLKIEKDFLKIINERCSHRVYTEEPLSILELSYLLWCSQGVKSIRGKAYASIRTVPCGGARHEFECYLAIHKVTGLKDGLYHYLPQFHAIEYLKEVENLPDFISRSLGGQSWANKANVVFYYSYVAYRSEWRYGIYSHRVVLIDAGHITENVYLSATSINLGACALGYIDEEVLDEAFELDGQEEFMFYACPVGKISPQDKTKEDDFYAFVNQENL